VLIETEGFETGKVGGEIKDVIRDEKSWKKMTYWYRPPAASHLCRPQEFNQKFSGQNLPEGENDDAVNDLEEDQIG
jgi:hypothetical protein